MLVLWKMGTIVTLSKEATQISCVCFSCNKFQCIVRHKDRENKLCDQPWWLNLASGFSQVQVSATASLNHSSKKKCLGLLIPGPWKNQTEHALFLIYLIHCSFQRRKPLSLKRAFNSSSDRLLQRWTEITEGKTFQILCLGFPFHKQIF